MEDVEISRFVKGFNHGWALSEADFDGKVVNSLLKASRPENGASHYFEGFQTAIKSYQKEKLISRGMEKFKNEIRLSKKHPGKGKDGPEMVK